MVTYNHQDDGLQTAISVFKPTKNHLMVTYNHQSQPAMLYVTYYHIQGGWLTTTTHANAKTSQNSVQFPNQSRVNFWKEKEKKSLAALWRDISENNSAPVDETPQSSGW